MFPQKFNFSLSLIIEGVVLNFLHSTMICVKFCPVVLEKSKKFTDRQTNACHKVTKNRLSSLYLKTLNVSEAPSYFVKNGVGMR